jgi:hypothetical protein
MENNSTSLDALVERLETYGKTSYELVRLRAVKKTAEVISMVFPRLALSAILLLFGFCATIGLALWLGDILGRPWIGFVSIALLYACAAIVLHHFLREPMRKRISRIVITQLLN